MDPRLLREYVTLLIEKIRTEKGASSKFSEKRTASKFGDKFSLQRFKQLDSIHMMLAYANDFLNPIGEGSSRRAYVLSGKYALKIARNDKGLAQNEAELDVFTNPQSKPIVAKVYSADSNNRWLVSDLVKPLKSESEFEQLTGQNWQAFKTNLKSAMANPESLSADMKWFKAVVATARDNNLMRGDLTVLDHWGKTPDGRAVLLDYGFTHEVFQSHYSDKDVGPTVKQDDKTKKPGSDSFGKVKAASDLGHAPTSRAPAAEQDPDKTRR